MSAFDQLASHGVESFDAWQTEVFDSEGRVLRPVVDGFSVQYEEDPGAASQPDRLAELMRQFFHRLTKKRDLPYKAESESCASLAELVALLVRFRDRH
jgi:hypothetical protein